MADKLFAGFRVLLFLTVFGARLHAQPAQGDTLRVLPVIEVRGDRLRELSAGLKIREMDSLSLATNLSYSLSDLLSMHSFVYMKDYGPGNLSSPSLRGATASQVGLVWNGFDIRSRTLGMSDVAIISSFFFDGIEVQHGGSGTLHGSGNLGGSLHLFNESMIQKGLGVKAMVTLGSFGQYDEGVKLSYGKGYWSSTSAFIKHDAENDFSYHYGGSSSRQSHANAHGIGFYQSLNRNNRRGDELNISLWFQEDKRQVPPPAIGSFGKEYKTDGIYRLSARWNKILPWVSLSTGLAFVNDDLKYWMKEPDSILLFDSRVNNHILMGDFIASFFNTERSRLVLIGGFETADANIESNGGRVRQDHGHLTASFIREWFDKRWRTSLHLRKGLAEGYAIPFCPSFGLDGKISPILSINLNLSRNFRIPTLNDRFWQPGGNQNLLPEESWNIESGGSLTLLSKPAARQKLDLTLFSSRISNYILWVPLTNLWSAQNIQEVAINGIEVSTEGSYRIRPLRIETKAGFTLQRDQNLRKMNELDQTSGKQLIYSPEKKLAALIRAIYGQYSATFQGMYVGKTFASSDNTVCLPAYFLADLIMRFPLMRGKAGDLYFTFGLYNLFNEQYQVVMYYPMPGRSIRVNLTFTTRANK